MLIRTTIGMAIATVTVVSDIHPASPSIYYATIIPSVLVYMLVQDGYYQGLQIPSTLLSTLIHSYDDYHEYEQRYF